MLLEDINSIIKAAEAGDADAQHKLGFMYEEGRGLPYDEEKATEWYLKAAKQGHPEAQKDLGYRYFNGEGTPINYEESLKWFKAAYENGYNDENDFISVKAETCAQTCKDLIIRVAAGAEHCYPVLRGLKSKN